MNVLLLPLLPVACTGVVSPEALRVYNVAGSDTGASSGHTAWVAAESLRYIRFEWTPDADFASSDHGCPWYRELLDSATVGEGEYYVGAGAVTLYGRADGSELVMPVGEGLKPDEWFDLDGVRWVWVEDDAAPSGLTDTWDPTCR